MLQISVGKLNQLINGSYDSYFIRRSNEELEQSRPDGSFATEEAIKEYNELVNEWRLDPPPNRDVNSLPTEAWLREKDPKHIIPCNYKRTEKAWSLWIKKDHD